MDSSQLLRHTIDRPFSRAETCDLRRAAVQLESPFGVQEQKTAGSPIESEANLPIKPGFGCSIAHALHPLVPVPVRRTPWKGNRACAIESPPS